MGNSAVMSGRACLGTVLRRLFRIQEEEEGPRRSSRVSYERLDILGGLWSVGAVEVCGVAVGDC